MKNIVIVNGYLQIGGAEKVLVFLANLLSSYYNIYFIVLRKTQKELFKLNSNVALIELNLEDNRVSSEEMGILGSLRYFVKTSNILKSKFKELNAHAVIAFNDREIILTWISLLFQPHIKCIFSQRNAPSSKRKITNRLLRFIYAHSDGVALQLEDVRKFYKLDKCKKCVIIENPITINENVNLVENPVKRILAAGRLDPQKRFDLLIDTFAKFVNLHDDYILEIYGEGYLKDELQNQILQLNLQDKVSINKPIPSLTKVKVDSEMFVLCSDWEGIPNIVLEAMSVGIPCIVTDFVPGGGRLVTNNGECGLLIPPNNVEALLGAMEAYSNNISLRNEKRNKALKYIENFKEEVISQKWLEFIRNIVEK